MELTKGELLELIKDLSNDTKIIVASDNFELKGNMVDARVYVESHKATERTFRDGFDNTNYKTTIYEYSENGEEVIVIRG